MFVASLFLLFYYKIGYYKSYSQVKLENNGTVNFLGCTTGFFHIKPNFRLFSVEIRCNNEETRLYTFNSISFSFIFSPHYAKITSNRMELCNIDLKFHNCQIILVTLSSSGDQESFYSEKIKVILNNTNIKSNKISYADYEYNILKIEDDLDNKINTFSVNKLMNLSAILNAHICFPYYCMEMSKIGSIFTYTLGKNILILDPYNKEVSINRTIRGIFAGYKIIIVSRPTLSHETLFEIIEISYKDIQLIKKFESNRVYINTFDIKINKPSKCDLFVEQNNNFMVDKLNLINNNDLNLTYVILERQYLIYTITCVFISSQSFSYAIYTSGYHLYEHETTKFTENKIVSTSENLTYIINSNQSALKTDYISIPDNISTQVLSNGSAETTNSISPQKSSSKTIIVITVVLILVIILLGIAGYLLYRRKFQNA